MKQITYEVSHDGSWGEIPNMTIIEIGSRYAIKFEIGNQEVTDPKKRIDAAMFYMSNCNAVLRRFSSGKKYAYAKKERDMLTAYISQQNVELQNENP